MAQASLQTRFADSPLRRYGLPAVSCLLATVFSVLAEHYGFRDIAVPLYLFAISVSVWYAGSGPAALAVILSIVFFDYLFTEPRYSFYVSASELPYFAVFVAFAFLVAWFSAVRRRVERDLRQVKAEANLALIPVVVLTSSKEEKDMVASYKLGVNAYVVKPVDFHEFVNAIRELGVFWAIITEPPPGSVRK